MRTRNTSNSATVTAYNSHRSDAADDFVLSSDESEVEKFEAKYYEVNPVTVGKKGNRGKRGQLKNFQTFPLDIVLEIFSYLEPLDVLRLSRTSRDMRTFLMTRNNTIIWRTARSNVPDFPPLPSDLSEPQYASLAFDSYCRICSHKPCENIIWQCRVRCCNKCFNTAFYSRPDLHSIWNRSYAATFIVFDQIDIPYVPVSPWKGPWGGEDKVYFPPNVRTLRHEYRRVRKNELALEDWVSQRQHRYAELMEHASSSSKWQKSSNDFRAKQLQLIRSQRKTAIYNKLRDLGWGDEIDRQEAVGNTVLSAHRAVRQSKDLTDKVWNRIQPALVKLLEETRRSAAE
ncbi:hypothetical protein BDP27DRAFT_1288092 [Rhodocollybia butyracea]|uniref:F-box domain-containing protein n=1 Tax=Rhodocollybia butyracea TaxID=206335 RepID=A0A9P5Q4I9_9AGAR|nr:hypothetical protein BDP27DRAFT_1288092 [Rhodocollybia butyracea]